jgi:phosphocarrier protein HPr
MRECLFIAIAQYGLDVRECALVGQAAGRYQSSFIVSTEGDPLEGNARVLMELMMLAAYRGTLLRVRVSGPDEDKAMEGFTRELEEQEVLIRDHVPARGEYEIFMEIKRAGRAALKKGDYYEAYVALKAVARKYPEDEVLWQELVSCARKINQAVQASYFAKEGLRHHPKSAWLSRELADQS